MPMETKSSVQKQAYISDPLMTSLFNKWFCVNWTCVFRKKGRTLVSHNTTKFILDK